MENLQEKPTNEPVNPNQNLSTKNPFQNKKDRLATIRLYLENTLLKVEYLEGRVNMPFDMNGCDVARIIERNLAYAHSQSLILQIESGDTSFDPRPDVKLNPLGY